MRIVPVLAMTLAAAVTPAARASERARSFRAVVLLTVDTLRADHLGLYGESRSLTPSMDALGADAVTFDRAVSTCPATGPSVASMLTGHHRAVHGVERNGSRLTSGVTTLAEVLRAAGLRTAAVVANDVLGHTGYDRGFESFTLVAPDTVRPQLFRDAKLVKTAGRLLREFRGASFFLWLHMMAPHGPYMAPPAYVTLLQHEDFRRPIDHPLTVGRSNFGIGMLPHYQYLGGIAAPDRYRWRYAAEIRYVDDLVGMFVSQLRRLGVWDDTLLVLTADHGESLGEHDLWFQHGWYVYDDTVRVPLAIRAPKLLPAGTRVRESVSLVDLMPTVLDLLALPARAGLEGSSLVPLVEGSTVDRTAFVQNYYANQLTALTRGRWKYVHTPPPAPARRPNVPPTRESPPAAREELYDVVADPGETHDLAASRPELRQQFGDETRRWLSAQRTLRRAAVQQRVSAPGTTPQDRRRLEDALRALGYAD